MTKRIISAAIAIPIGIVVLYFYNTLFFNFAIAAIAVTSTYEILLATKYLQNRLLSLVSLLFVATVPFYPTSVFGKYASMYILIFVTALFVVMLFKHKRIRFEQVGMVFLVSTLIPYALSTLIFIRDRYPKHALFYIVLALLGAWISDAGAYFIGTFFGKTKLAPTISPKKTVEGFIGGVITSALVLMFSGMIYSFIQSNLGNEINVNYLMLLVVGVISALLGVLGDLSASIIKRECLVKDFGNILPGHGGALDRFDSVLFVAPFIYQTLFFVQIIY